MICRSKNVRKGRQLNYLIVTKRSYEIHDMTLSEKNFHKHKINGKHQNIMGALNHHIKP